MTRREPQPPDNQPAQGPVTTDDDLDPALAAVLWDTYSRRVDVETAASHLWRIDRAAAPRSRRTPRRLLVAMLTGLMLVGFSTGALAASAHAVPGDMLYAVKRSAEQGRLLLALTPQRDARIHLSMARTRLAEVEVAVRRRPEVVPELVAAAMSSLEQAQRTGGQAVAHEVRTVEEEATEKARDVVTAPAASPSSTPSTAPSSSGPEPTASAAPATAQDNATPLASEADSSPSASSSASPEPTSTPTASEDDTATSSASPSPDDSPSTSPSPEPSDSSSPSPEPSPTTSASPEPTPTPSSEDGGSGFDEVPSEDPSEEPSASPSGEEDPDATVDDSGGTTPTEEPSGDGTTDGDGSTTSTDEGA